MTDEFAIRQAARDLKRLYTHLDEMKHAAVTPPEVRTMQNTGGKPAMPGNWLWMHRGVDMAMRLQQVAFNAFGDLGKKIKDSDSGTLPLLELIALNAQPISELGWSSDFLEELEDQVSTLGKWLNPPDAGPVANEDPYLTADSIQRSLTNKGLGADPATIRQWASRGHVDTKTRRDGKRAYRLADIIKRLTGSET